MGFARAAFVPSLAPGVSSICLRYGYMYTRSHHPSFEILRLLVLCVLTPRLVCLPFFRPRGALHLSHTLCVSAVSSLCPERTLKRNCCTAAVQESAFLEVYKTEFFLKHASVLTLIIC